MNYEDDIYRQPVWNEQLAAEDEFNKAMMQVQTQPKVQEDDGGWGDLMKQVGSSMGGGQPQVTRTPLNITQNEPPEASDGKNIAMSFFKKWMSGGAM